MIAFFTSLFAKDAMKEAWAWFKPFAPYVAAVLATLLGWHMMAVHYRAQGRAESASIIASDKIAMQRGIDAIAALRRALNDKNAESLARAKAYQDSKSEDARNVADANARWEKSETARAALAKASKATTGCTVDPSIISAMETL